MADYNHKGLWLQSFFTVYYITWWNCQESSFAPSWAHLQACSWHLSKYIYLYDNNTHIHFYMMIHTHIYLYRNQHEPPLRSLCQVKAFGKPWHGTMLWYSSHHYKMRKLFKAIPDVSSWQWDALLARQYSLKSSSNIVKVLQEVYAPLPTGNSCKVKRRLIWFKQIMRFCGFLS